MATIHESMAALIAELAKETGRIIDKHLAEDEKGANVLQHYGPIGVQVHGIDGHLATFYEEGIEFYPSPEGGV